MDFTVQAYRALLQTMQVADYRFASLEAFLHNPSTDTIILRHDVDAMPLNSLQFAQIQHSQNIRGVYYFRAVPESWNEQIIRQISDMGHEIGYHYECLTSCRGNMKLAIQDFEKNLTALRRLAPVSTICMHGSPMSKYDSKDLWKTYSYSDFGIVGEPYFDIDFTKVAYLTDTGRRWDGQKVSVRDKVNTSFTSSYTSTAELITGLKNGQLPRQIMFTFHPQRWNNNPFHWLRELVFQQTKNVVKQYFYVK